MLSECSIPLTVNRTFPFASEDKTPERSRLALTFFVVYFSYDQHFSLSQPRAPPKPIWLHYKASTGHMACSLIETAT